MNACLIEMEVEGIVLPFVVNQILQVFTMEYLKITGFNHNIHDIDIFIPEYDVAFMSVSIIFILIVSSYLG